MEKPMTDDPGMAPDAAAQAQPGAEPPPDQPQDQPQDAGTAQDATPEEQAQYNQFVGRGMELIYNEKMFPQVVEMLRGGGNDGQGKEETGGAGSAQGLAHATAMIITRVYKAATDSGAQLSPDVLFHGGTEIFGQLAEISDKAGISNYAEDRDGLEAAYFLSVDTAMEQLRKAGVVDEASAKQALQQLHDMDAKGALEPVFRELDAMDQQSQGGAEPPPANDNAPSAQGGMAPQEEM